MKVEEEYTDVLQNIESIIAGTYRQHRELSDYGVMRALEALIDVYNAECIGRKPKHFNLSDVEHQLMDSMQGICEWRLGREQMIIDDESRTPIPSPEPLTVDEILLCLKRILKSVKFWNKEYGSQGYLNFIIQHT